MTMFFNRKSKYTGIHQESHITDRELPENDDNTFVIKTNTGISIIKNLPDAFDISIYTFRKTLSEKIFVNKRYISRFSISNTSQTNDGILLYQSCIECDDNTEIFFDNLYHEEAEKLYSYLLEKGIQNVVKPIVNHPVTIKESENTKKQLYPNLTRMQSHTIKNTIKNNPQVTQFFPSVPNNDPIDDFNPRNEPEQLVSFV